MKYFQFIILPILLVVSFQFTSINYKLIVFEGSDWCPHCIEFEKNVLQDSLFIQFAKENNILIERIDFPQRKQLDKSVIIHNEKMAELYRFDGSFPTILLVDASNNKIVKLKYSNQIRDQFISLLSINLDQFE